MRATAIKETRDGRPVWRWEPECAPVVSAWLARVKDGQRLTVEVARYRPQRSTDQCRYYWACLGELAEWCGSEAEDIHEEFKRRFLTAGPGPIPHTRSTTELTTVEFAAYVDQCARFAAGTLGWVWPEPAQIGYPQLAEQETPSDATQG